jgi:RNA polymerase sigma factor for flagellar operon FliA
MSRLVLAAEVSSKTPRVLLNECGAMGVGMPNLSEEDIQEAARKYFPLAVSLAKRRQWKLPPGVNELEDLIGAASVRLVECLHWYDPSRGTSLSQWVYQHLEGAITDYLRSLDPLPQKVREQVKRLRKAELELEKRWQRKPTSQEIAQHLGLPAREVHTIRRWESTAIDSLDSTELLPQSEPQEHGQAETYLALSQYWEQLSEVEKVAMSLHLNGARLEDIADVVAISRATAGRILQAALLKLHETIEPEGV